MAEEIKATAPDARVLTTYYCGKDMLLRVVVVVVSMKSFINNYVGLDSGSEKLKVWFTSWKVVLKQTLLALQPVLLGYWNEKRD